VAVELSIHPDRTVCPGRHPEESKPVSEVVGGRGGEQFGEVDVEGEVVDRP
jgi:hypothetical protein